MAGYFDWIKNSEIIIYGFFQEGILEFAVAIQDNHINEASGKYNTKLTDEEEKILTRWFLGNFT